MEIKQILETKKYFIFDMDGTILDLENLNYEGYRSTVKKFFDLDLSEEDYQKYFSGTRTALAFTGYLENKRIQNFDIEELIKDFRSVKRYNLQNNIEKVVLLKEGVIEYFEFLKNNRKKVALATSTVKEFVDLIIDHFGFRKYFDLILTAEDVVKGKPDPEIYNMTVSMLNAKKEDCVVFEDSQNGIQSAKSANILCIGIKTTGLNDDFVNDADYVIADYSELLTQ